MAIASAVDRGSFIFVYNEQGQQIATIPSGDQPGDGLQGYTSTTVSVRRGAFVFIYDERGQQISTVPAR